MVYERNGKPDEKVVFDDGPKAEYRVTYDEIPNCISIEHASGTRVHQGHRFDDPEVVDRLIKALQDLRPLMEDEQDE